VLNEPAMRDRFVRRRAVAARASRIVEVVDTAFETEHLPAPERVFDSRHALCVWRRPRLTDLHAAAAGIELGGDAVTRERLDATRPDVDRSLRLLPRGTGRDRIADDLRHLLDLYATITGVEEIGTRVAVTHGRTCPKFHVDGVGLRLICAWRGAGTEWLAEHDVDRRRLGRVARAAEGDIGVARPGAVIRSLQTLDVGLFKGTSWPGFSHRAIVHRSPPATGDWRILLTLDALA
jgi:hypothetical protein